MTKYRRKSVEIEAFRWMGGPVAGFKYVSAFESEHQGYLSISTAAGFLYASVGDWIITGVDGDKYPCKPFMFEQTYEAVEEPAAGTVEPSLETSNS